MAKNRLKDYPEEFWREIGVLVPEAPSEEELDAAYKTVAEFPVVYGMIEDFYESLQLLRRDPKLDPKHLRRILDRYGEDAETLLKVAHRLGRRMDEDVRFSEDKNDDS